MAQVTGCAGVKSGSMYKRMLDKPDGGRGKWENEVSLLQPSNPWPLKRAAECLNVIHLTSYCPVDTKWQSMDR